MSEARVAEAEENVLELDLRRPGIAAYAFSAPMALDS